MQQFLKKKKLYKELLFYTFLHVYNNNIKQNKIFN